MFGARILILVPHPDDEVVACSAAVARARAAGAEIFALYLTHGCVGRDVMWPWARHAYESVVARRRAEAEDVAKYMGITPVGWNLRAARTLWQNLKNVQVTIEDAVQKYAVDQLWVPAYEGGNPDHDALNAVGQLFRARLSVLEFAEYNWLGNQARAQAFPKPNGIETTLTLTGAEQAQKQKLLSLYASEKRNLNYVGVGHECFRPLADYDYSIPPHAGTLWYVRFQWVPFRHPGVDFTKPDDVSRAIVDFLRAATSAPPAPAKQ